MVGEGSVVPVDGGDGRVVGDDVGDVTGEATAVVARSKEAAVPTVDNSFL